MNELSAPEPRHPERKPKKAAIDFHNSSRWRAVEIGTARLLGELLNSCQCDRFACLLRQWWWRRLGRWAHLQRLGFAGVEPDELADATDFDFDCAAAFECDFDHWVTA